MTYLGHVQNGQIILNEEVELAEGLQVRVQVIPAASRTTLAERFGDILGKADDLPEDMAEQHDHYIHAAPKR